MQQLSEPLQLALKNQDPTEAMRLIISFARLHDNQPISSEELANLRNEAVQGICRAASEKGNWKVASGILLSLMLVETNFPFIESVVHSQLERGNDRNAQELMQSAPDYKWPLLFKLVVQSTCYPRKGDVALQIPPFLEDKENSAMILAILNANLDRRYPNLADAVGITVEDLFHSIPPISNKADGNETIAKEGNPSQEEANRAVRKTEREEYKSNWGLWSVELEFADRIEGEDFETAINNFRNAVQISADYDPDTANMILVMMVIRLAEAGRGSDVASVIKEGYTGNLSFIILGLAKAGDVENVGSLIPLFVTNVCNAYECAKLLTYLFPMQADKIVETIRSF